MRSNYFVTDRTSPRVSVTSSIARVLDEVFEEMCRAEGLTKSEKIRQLILECMKNSNGSEQVRKLILACSKEAK